MSEFDLDDFYENALLRELREQGRSAPLPPWLRHPEIPRYSIGWRMGYGEDYLGIFGHWAEKQSSEEILAYYREFAPIPPAWVDWVGMSLASDEPEDEELSFDELIKMYGEGIAHLGLFDIEAWKAYLEEGLDDEGDDDEEEEPEG